MAEALTQDKTKSIEINKVQVLNFSVNTWPKEQAAIIVNWAVGYNDVDGKFIPVEPKPQVNFIGEDFVRIVTAKADGSLSLYENIKNALYIELSK